MDRTDEFLATTRLISQSGEAVVNHNDAPTEALKKGKLSRDDKARHDEFVRVSAFLTNEVLVLSNEIKSFIRSTRDGVLGEQTSSILTSSGSIKAHVDELGKSLKGLIKLSEGCRSKQLRDHYQIIIRSLQKRLDTSSKEFLQTVQRVSKNASQKQAIQSSRYGALKVHLPVQTGANAALPQFDAKSGRGKAYRSPTPKPVGFIQGNTRAAATDSSLRRRGFDLDRQNSRFPSTSMEQVPLESAYSRGDHEGHTPQFSARQVAMYDHQLLEKRRLAMEMENTQKSISEVGQMYMQVASLVSEQEELTNQIGIDIEDSLENVQSGREQLLIYYNNLTQERQMILKLLLVTACLGAFFIYFWS